jgi:hypothetical protein
MLRELITLHQKFLILQNIQACACKQSRVQKSPKSLYKIMDIDGKDYLIIKSRCQVF